MKQSQRNQYSLCATPEPADLSGDFRMFAFQVQLRPSSAPRFHLPAQHSRHSDAAGRSPGGDEVVPRLPPRRSTRSALRPACSQPPNSGARTRGGEESREGPAPLVPKCLASRRWRAGHGPPVLYTPARTKLMHNDHHQEFF